MRIGVDIRSLMEKTYSGVSIYTQNILREIFRLDAKNEYFLFFNSGKPVAIPEFSYPNVRVIKSNIPNKLFNASLRFLQKPNIDKKIGGVDIFFFPNINFYSVSDTCKIVTTIHDVSFERYPNFFSLKSKLWHKLIQPKKLCERSNHLIAVSEHTKKEIMDMYKISEEKITIIYSGIDENIHEVSDNAMLQRVKEKYNLPDFFILYLGNIESRKNISGIIRGFLYKEIPWYCHLVLAGFGKYRNFLPENLENESKNRIHYIGYIDQKDTCALYSLSKIFLYISFYEGFGFPPLEAMACGVPTIISAASSLPEVAGDASIIVDPYNIRDISKAIQYLIEDNGLRRAIIEKGKLQIKKYRWENSARKVIEIFSNI